MSKQLLTLTFHSTSLLLREDIVWKQQALTSKLLDSEALGDFDAGDFPRHLKTRRPPEIYSGLSEGTFTGTKHITLNTIGVNAWIRPPYKQRPNDNFSDFDDWIKPKIEAPCSCLMLCGHHGSFKNKGVTTPLLWGAEDRRVAEWHRFYTAIKPVSTQTDTGVIPSLEILGHPYSRNRNHVLRAGPYDLSKTLKNCRLIIIMGCNGITEAGHQNTISLGHYWQEWVQHVAKKKPVVLGWYGKHHMPRNGIDQNIGKVFWPTLKTLAGGQTSVEQIYQSDANLFIKAWGKALKDIYSTSKSQRYLWYGNEEGAGALDSDGKIWKVLSSAGDLEPLS